MLISCGGEQDVKSTTSVEKNSVGNAVVSGAAVSGPAIIEKNVEPKEYIAKEVAEDVVLRTRAKSESDNHENKTTRFSAKENSNYLYKVCEERLEQWTKTGEIVKEYAKVPGIYGKYGLWDSDGEMTILFVTDDEIVYKIQVDESSSIWRIPIVQKKDGEELQIERAENLFSENEVAFLYQDERYICIFDMDEMTYHEYDREKRKMNVINTENDSLDYEIACFYSWYDEIENKDKDNWGSVFLPIQDSRPVILLRDPFMYGEESDIYAHRIGSGKVVKLPQGCREDYCVTAWGNQMIYMPDPKPTLKKDGKGEFDIRWYDGDTKTCGILIKEKQWKKVFAEQGMNKINRMYLYMDEDTLYIEGCQGKRSGFLTYSLKDGGTVTWESSLNTYLNQKKVYVEEVLNGKCLYRIGEKNRYSYDFVTKQRKQVTKHDAENMYWLADEF